MVFRKKAKTTRRYKRYRRYSRRRGYGRGGRSTRRIARRAYRIAKRIQSSIETKYSLVNSGSYGPTVFAVSTTTQNIELTNLGQGDGYNTRDGLQAMFTRIVGTWQAGYGDPVANYIRVVIWKPLDFTPYTTSDITNYYINNVGAIDVAAFRDWPLRKSIKILWSKLIYVDPTNYPLRRGNFSIKIRNKVLYSDGGATIASVSKGALFMSYWSDSSVSPHPTFGFYIRMYFQDI